MTWQRWSNDEDGNKEEIDPTTNQPTSGQGQGGQSDQSELGELAEQRPTEPEWLREAEEWAEKNWYNNGK